MDVTSWALLGIGGFVAVTALVSLMRRRRDELVAELTEQARQEQEQRRVEEWRDKKKQKKAG